MVETLAQPRPSSRRVPRWVWFVVVCIALGAMTSVGVAWGIACRNMASEHWTQGPPIYVLARTPDSAWHLAPMSSFGRSDTFVSNTDLRDYEWFQRRCSELKIDAGARLHNLDGLTATLAALRRHEAALPLPERRQLIFFVSSFGWPAKCATHEYTFSTHQLPATRADELTKLAWISKYYPASQWPDAEMMFDVRRATHAILVDNVLLPTFPLWPGLLANTAIYGGAWAVVLGVPILLRRWFRAKRRGCPQCGYSREGLKVDAACPECGRTPAAAHDATTIPATR